MSNDSMLKVDIHNHILPDNIPDFKSEFGYGGFIKLQKMNNQEANMIKDSGEFFRAIKCNCWDSNLRIEEHKSWNLKVQVISTVPVMFSYFAKPKDGLKVSQFLNDNIASTISSNPENYLGLGTLPMQDPELASGEIERCLKDLNFSGFEIGSHINNWKLNAKELEPFYETANHYEIPLFIHPWEMPWTSEEYWMGWLVGMPAETTRAINSLIFGGIMEKYPKIRFTFAHGGGSFPGTFGRISHGYDVKPDLVGRDNKVNPSEYIGRFWTDSLVHSEDALNYLVNFIGIDKVMLGTDYPFPLGELNYPGRLVEENKVLNEEQKRKILGENALKWLKVSKNKFS